MSSHCGNSLAGFRDSIRVRREGHRAKNDRIRETNMNEITQSVETALQLFEPAADLAYSIESVAHITQVPRYLIAVYCRDGFITPIGQPELEGWWFDDEAIRALRRIELLRAEYGMNLRGIRLVLGMNRELEALRDEVRFSRGR
jgi:hypothetical protein